MSGAELTGLSGFTNMSTIGPLSGESADEEDVGHRAQTPMRKRLSMAAKDLGHITPRFPKTPPESAQYQFVSDADDDDDDDPCTENIGEFADLDSQMNDLQMQLGVQKPLFTIFRD
ncbi:hypothetical protein IWW35_005687 [Coemansia sp. RSA 1878]|nr:hypothetical protein IWW35_005687 [Coemansia sp. RSA 1878]